MVVTQTLAKWSRQLPKSNRLLLVTLLREHDEPSKEQLLQDLREAIEEVNPAKEKLNLHRRGALLISYKISLSEKFQKEAKRPTKKYPSLKIDLLQLIETLEEGPIEGDALGDSCYKVRLRISSKGKGKSGGARVITHVHIAQENVYVLTIYDKLRKEDLGRGELESLLKMIRQ